MLFTARISQIETAITDRLDLIAELEQRIEALRQENLEQQQFLQALGSAESAATSALGMVTNAIAMIRTVDPSQLEIFCMAIEAAFAADVPILAPEADETAGVEVLPSENDQEDGSIEVEVITTYSDMKLAELRAECRKLNLDHKGNKSDLISRLEKHKGGSEPANNDYPIAA